MAEEIIFTTPQTVGDLINQKSVDRLKVAAISFNRQASHEARGTVVLAILLEHPATGVTHNVVYEGAEALNYARFINTGDFSVKSLHTRILEKMLADGKLPAGTIAGNPD